VLTRFRLAYAAAGLLSTIGFVACAANAPQRRAAKAAPAPLASSPAKTPGFDRLARSDFNRRAVELNLPIFWRNDADADGALDPDELVVLFAQQPTPRAEFVGPNGEFTPSFHDSYERMLRPEPTGTWNAEERARREAVRLELSQGRPTLIESDFSRSSVTERALAAHLVDIARLIERLYAKQRGTAGLEKQSPPDDPASAALFFRNQGPFCEAPKTEQNPACHALPVRASRAVGLYPASIQSDPKFCELLERQPNAKDLLDHFSVVVPGKRPDTFAAEKYSRAYPEETRAIAESLERAAAVLGSEEAALAKYLLAAAGSFRSDDWEPANEAWVAMSSENSKFYLRVGPDEVYFEPCAWKAGFALTFARINGDSLAFRARLEPIKQELENEVAMLAGKPYRARTVKFKLPDFIDIVLNAGDSRAPLGGTIGQSLPNWGGVAKRGGRTVTMTNIGIDDDSQRQSRELMSSMFCSATMQKVSTDPKVSRFSVVLHEAAHNLGPSHDYAVNGKVSEVAFGGGLAAMLEELKAQTAALYFPARLVEKKLLSAEEAELAYINDVAWAFGHTAQGMYEAAGQPRHYSQLASIQLGVLTEAGALHWKPEEMAANARDRGCFELDFTRFQPAVRGLMQQVLEIKAQGDRARAEKLKAVWVDADGAWKKVRSLISERWLRAPKASYVYGIQGLTDAEQPKLAGH
jgi:hypothetical protein